MNSKLFMHALIALTAFLFLTVSSAQAVSFNPADWFKAIFAPESLEPAPSSFSFPGKCQPIVCSDGIEYPTCSDSGSPINYLRYPCEGVQGALSPTRPEKNETTVIYPSYPKTENIAQILESIQKRIQSMRQQLNELEREVAVLKARLRGTGDSQPKPLPYPAPQPYPASSSPGIEGPAFPLIQQR